MEIEVLADENPGYRLRVTEFMIDGGKVDPTSVHGLPELLARRNFVRIQGGYCERTGETIGIQELPARAQPGATGSIMLSVRYRERP